MGDGTAAASAVDAGWNPAGWWTAGGSNPCVGLSKPSPETQRDRVLTEDEIRAVWAGCDAEPGIIVDAFRRPSACASARRCLTCGSTISDERRRR
jgi:hypothetical protein